MADFLDEVPKTERKRCDRAFLVGVQTHDMATGEAAELLDELEELVQNLRIEIVGRELVNLRQPTPATLIGSGKTEEIIAAAKAAEADLIVFDESLSPAQQRNWEKASGLAVIDREEVILDIFADRASTREAVLQVALARMQYSLPRLTRAWTSGEGETQLEQDRRLVNDRIVRLKRELADVRKQRGVQRHKRQRVPVPTAAIVGYTNAGKSSLLNALTGASVLAEDKLFATLDPTTRQLLLRGNQKLLVTDTVGFIRRLPHGLVEAFKATLEEAIVADFLIHVLDVTAANVAAHHATTLSVLGELGADAKRVITVFNKVDAADEAQLMRARALAPEAIYLSAKSGQGLPDLVDRCLELIADAFGQLSVLIPHARYDLIARAHQIGHVQQEEQRDDGVFLKVRIPPNQQAPFLPFAV
ncbi:MAG: GTPase HflX [Opitutaceae bacterium]|nr:GTPase HflX [Opitutaceae bacterium]